MKLIGKHLFSAGAQLVILILFTQSDGQLIQWEDYLRNVGKTFIGLIQDREISGAGMPVQSFNATMNMLSNLVTNVGYNCTRRGNDKPMLKVFRIQLNLFQWPLDEEEENCWYSVVDYGRSKQERVQNPVCNNVTSKADIQTLYDITASGIARFHSGFVAKIDASGILSTSYRSQVVDAYSNVLCVITFNGIQTVYDVDYEYDNFKGRGTVLTWFKQIEFEMLIQRNHTTHEITSEIKSTNNGNQNDYIVKVHPNNGYTQLTAKEIKRTMVFREPMTNSFKDWTETWRNELRTAVSEYMFPEICYYCP